MYNWLINHIPKPVRKSVGVFKDKIASFLKTNTFTQTVYGRGKKLSTPRRQNIKKSFILRENKKQNKIKKKNKDRIEIFEYFLKQKKKKKRKKKRNIMKD